MPVLTLPNSGAQIQPVQAGRVLQVSFSSFDILSEFAEATSMVPNGDVFWEQCERHSARNKVTSLKRWHKWYSFASNRVAKLAYMRAYRDTDEQREKRRVYMAQKRALLPIKPPRVLKGKNTETKETRRLRYLRAKAQGYLSRPA